jgi:hypothetical protein
MQLGYFECGLEQQSALCKEQKETGLERPVGAGYKGLPDNHHLILLILFTLSQAGQFLKYTYYHRFSPVQ